MSKRIITNEYDYERKIEKVETTWPNGSKIIVMSNVGKMKTKIHVIDCSSGVPELVGCKKFKLDDSSDAIKYLMEWQNKFEEDVE